MFLGFSIKSVCLDTIRSLSVCFAVGAFQSFLTAVMALQYTEQPDYSALKAGLSSALLQMGGSQEQTLCF